MQRSSQKIEIWQFAVALLVLVGSVARASAAPVRSFASDDLRSAIARTARGETLRLVGVEQEGAKDEATLDLERFEVYTDDATITVHGKGGRTRVLPRPMDVFFRGTVRGVDGSRAFLAVHEDGSVEGIVRRGARVDFVGGEDAPAVLDAGPLRLRTVPALALATMDTQAFACGNERLPERPPSLQQRLAEQAVDAGLAATPVTAQLALPAHTARVAIETDFEFYQRFNNTATASAYIANLVGWDSAVAYVPELGTSLQVSSISLWTTNADPWTQTSTLCGLAEFGKYWNVNRTGVSRTIAHFLSGKSLGGGIAWLGVLCSGGFASGMASSCPALGAESTPWGGGYGFTANIGGAFNLNSPTVMWDSMAVAHEIGHNFDSPHSHCYKNIGGNANPIDGCTGAEGGSASCFAGAGQLPGVNSLSGIGKGTIMSYCHLLGGYSSVAMTFGSAPGFAYGIAPGREAALMNGYVAATAASNAACLAPTGPAIASISPASGGSAGGQSVTIAGSGFVAGATVTIGGSPATNVSVANATTITARTPAHALGIVQVVVTNPSNGTAVLPAGYTYTSAPVGPAVTATAPASGPLTGGTLVTITGSNFASGATATFGGASPVATTWVDSNTLRATAPENSAGIKSVTVTNPGGAAATLANGFFYANESGATRFFTVTPCRALDTRTTGGAIAANGTRTVTIAGGCGIPAGAKSVAMNVTTTGAAASGVVTLYPGNAFPLGTSALNTKAGVTRSNNAMAQLATNGAGTVGITNASAGAVHVIVDVSGYWQ